MRRLGPSGPVRGVPSRDQLIEFLEQAIIKARRAGDTAAVDDLLDKRRDIDTTHEFLCIVAPYLGAPLR